MGRGWQKGGGGGGGRGYPEGRGGGGGGGRGSFAGGGKGKKGGAKGGGGGGNKPTDDPDFVKWSVGMVLDGSERGVSYVVEAYVASGTFSRVFRVKELSAESRGRASAKKSRWERKDTTKSEEGEQEGESKVFAAKVMRRNDSYIQYTSDAEKEGRMLQQIEQVQRDKGREVFTMRCFDSFATKDDAGEEYWCLILEWLDASLNDVVRANGNRGLHLSMVRVMLSQLLEQLCVLQELECTHTDIKHKNCCLADTLHFRLPAHDGGRDSIVLVRPVAKFIDYGNAVFEGDKKTHPIHTKQFRAPEVLLNVAQGWGPPSDMWTLGVTVAFLLTGQLIFNSHEPSALIYTMTEALGPFPASLLEAAKDGRMRGTAEKAGAAVSRPQLAQWLGLTGFGKDSPEERCADLVQKMLAPEPADRVTAIDALRHPFIANGLPKLPQRPEGAELRLIGAAGGAEGARGKGGGK